MLSAKRSRASRREMSAAARIPYSAHVAPTVIKTVTGDYLQAFRLGGASFESRDDEQLNNWHERLNVFWRNVANPQVAIWTHVVRRREQLTPLHEARDPAAMKSTSFADALEIRYRDRLSCETLMVNELYLAVIYRPTTTRTAGLFASLFTRTHEDTARLEVFDALDACRKLAQQVHASLARYEPDDLGLYSVGPRQYSALLEYLGLLVNGEHQAILLPHGPISEALAINRLFFGHEAIEYRMPASTRVGAILGIKEYPTPSTVGMFDRLLSAPFPFVLTQSFTFLTKATSQTLLQRQFNRMVNAGDFAVSQAEELKEALDALTSNEFVIGDHHFSLQILDDLNGSPVDGREHDRLRTLNDRIAQACSFLADTGMAVAREDLALEGAFWAQLPGNFSFRPRKAPITSRNLAAMAPFHNFPRGRPKGNHWGDALTTLVTRAASPFYFSLHASDPGETDGRSRKDTGHTLICGPTGSGKTVFIGFMVALLSRQGVSQIIFDKDRGLEILVRALEGEYLPLRNGVPTGFNPLQLPPTPSNVEFLKSWLRELVVGSPADPGAAGHSARADADLDQALRGTLALELPSRRLSRLVEFLDRTETAGVHARLSRWCNGHSGDYAWVFDNQQDSVLSRMEQGTLIGFDVTEFLDNSRVRTPVTLYLFHLVRQLLDGRKLVCWMDEFWRLLADPAFEVFAKDGPKTWRKLNAVMCLATQSASDVLDSPISRTLVEQTPTKIFFPNSEAHPDDYIGGFGLSQKEFALIQEQLEPGSRMFLVKQAHHSIVCQLDLKGLDAETAVISGREAQVRRMHELILQGGAAPAAWLPRLLSEQ